MAKKNRGKQVATTSFHETYEDAEALAIHISQQTGEPQTIWGAYKIAQTNVEVTTSRLDRDEEGDPW